jgi:hypothetical protein
MRGDTHCDGRKGGGGGGVRFPQDIGGHAHERSLKRIGSINTLGGNLKLV